MMDFQKILRIAIDNAHDYYVSQEIGSVGINEDKLDSMGFSVDDKSLRDRLETKGYVANIIITKK